MKNKILVLGHKGMLGHMVVRYFTDNGYSVEKCNLRWPDNKKEILDFKGDFIINCIGKIPQKNKKCYEINWQLPIWLDLNSPCRVIHPGTDCEMDLDDYGISKNIAGKYIREMSTKTKSIKTSIIGPELNQKCSLLEWFLSQKEQVFGYTKALWNGNTTLEWCKQCQMIIEQWDSFPNEIIISSNQVSKYELLVIFNSVFNRKITVVPKAIGHDKRLKPLIKTKNIEQQLIELKNYYYKQEKK